MSRDPRILIKNRKELVEEMKDKYGYLFCEKCQRSSGFYKLHVHHIIFRSETTNPDVHKKENLLICCDKCHLEFHGKKDIRNQLVKERNLNYLYDGA